MSFAVSSNKHLITFCFGVQFFMSLLFSIGKLYIFDLKPTNAVIVALFALYP